MSEKVNVNVEYLKALAEYAKRNRTEHAWMDVALEWMEGAKEHIAIAFHPEIGWAVDPEVYKDLAEKYEELVQKHERVLEEGRCLFNARVEDREKMFTSFPEGYQKQVVSSAYPNIARTLQK